MANTAKQLTYMDIRLAKSKEKEYNLADEKRLYLKVKSAGSICTGILDIKGIPVSGS